MSYKLEILKALDSLRRFDLDRRQIEMELGYSDRYLDQVLSKGGSKTVLNRLTQLKEKYELQNPTSEAGENEEIYKYKLEKEEREQAKKGKTIAEKDIFPNIETIQKELGDVAKGGDMTSMFLMLIEHLQAIASGVSETRELARIATASLGEMGEIARENNSLARTVLLNQAREQNSDWSADAQKRFEASLEVARTLLRQTAVHS